MLLTGTSNMIFKLAVSLRKLCSHDVGAWRRKKPPARRTERHRLAEMEFVHRYSCSTSTVNWQGSPLGGTPITAPNVARLGSNASRFGTMAPPGKLETKQQTSMHHVMRLDGIETFAPILNLAIRHYVRPTPLSLCPAISLKLPLHKPTPYATIGRHGGKPMTILGVTRREFVAALGGAAAWPVVARGQQPGVPTVGYLHQGSPRLVEYATAAFRDGLRAAGYVAGENISIEDRWADGIYERLPALAADLVGRQVNVIMAALLPAALAVKGATLTIPVVFISGSDPVTRGLVTSLNRPGGNITGVTIFSSALIRKRVELMRQLGRMCELLHCW